MLNFKYVCFLVVFSFSFEILLDNRAISYEVCEGKKKNYRFCIIFFYKVIVIRSANRTGRVACCTLK